RTSPARVGRDVPCRACAVGPMLRSSRERSPPVLDRRALSIALFAAAFAGCSPRSDLPVAPNARPPLGGPLVVRNQDFSARQVFPPDNWWNLDVSQAPVDSQSQAIIDWISGRPQNPTGRARLHPDFGPPPYGMPYIGVSSSQPLDPL